MRNIFIIFSLMAVVLLVSACSGEESDSSSEEAADDMATTEDSSEAGFSDNRMQEGEMANNQNEASDGQEEAEAQAETDVGDLEVQERKIIYNASLHLETENFSETITYIEDQTKQFNGYMVSSESSEYEEAQRRGSMTVRIPSEDFRSFLEEIENGNITITNESTRGEDVTEQYVDLQSRLEAKKVVEERLLSFMEEAENTENLLKISSDLADVQEEIEQLTGKINYLENQASYATIDLVIVENNVEVANVQDESLNTWEKTKEQFTNSVNTLLSMASGIFIFFIGNAPVLILLILLGGAAYFVIRQRIKRK